VPRLCRRFYRTLQYRCVCVRAHSAAVRWLLTVVRYVRHLRVVCVPGTAVEVLRALLRGAGELETLELYAVGCGAAAGFFDVLLDAGSDGLRRLRVEADGNFIRSADVLCAGIRHRPTLEVVELRLGANPLDPGAALAQVARAVRSCPLLWSLTLCLPDAAPHHQQPVGPSQTLRVLPGGLRRLHLELSTSGAPDVAPVVRVGPTPTAMRELTVCSADPLGFRQSCVEAGMLAASLPAGPARCCFLLWVVG
jgi:hypothetical protein